MANWLPPKQIIINSKTLNTKWRLELITLILLVLVGGLALRNSLQTHRIDPEPTKRGQLDIWLDALVWQESRASSTIKVLDSNNKFSYGCLQFQEDTFITQKKKYHMEGNIYDCDFQISLAKTMIEDNWNNYDHWRTSTKKIGKPPLLAKK